jgi:TrkA domain protein
MPEIRETVLPGVGVRHEFTTASGERLALLTHRSGRRELAVYDDPRDPDASRTVLHLSPDDTVTFGELLGTSQVSEAILGAQRLEGLAIDWLTVPANSGVVGTTIADGQFRTKTGVSVVAIVRDDVTIPAPEPDTSFESGDVVVAVGTPEGLQLLRTLLGS